MSCMIGLQQSRAAISHHVHTGADVVQAADRMGVSHIGLDTRQVS